MYANYQALESDPFATPPRPDIFFESDIHKGALSFIASHLQAGEQFVLLTGEYGTGKTLLSLKLIQALKKGGQGNYVYISNPVNGYREILHQGHRALGLGEPSPQMTTDQLLSRLYRHFEDRTSPRQLIVILEDPQDLDEDTLHRIRLLANYNVEGHFPFRFVLCAHSSLIDRLRRPEWQALDQRIKLRYQLTPLTREETREYIYFRLFKAHKADQNAIGPFSPYFQEAAIARVHELTQGIPRSVNTLCGMALKIAGARSIVGIEVPIVEEAAAYLDWQGVPDHSPAPPEPVLPAGPAHSPAPTPHPDPYMPPPAHPNRAPHPATGTPPQGPPPASAERAEQAPERGLDAKAPKAEPREEGIGLGRAESEPGSGDFSGGSSAAASGLATWIWRATVVLFLLLIVAVLIARNLHWLP